MNGGGPPCWLERVLLLLLSARDRDSVSGDLYEEFREQKSPQIGSFRAGIWYARQVLSFVPWKFGTAFVQRRALTLLCIFTAMAGVWLGCVDLYLKRAGYADREVIAGIIISQALLTLLSLRIRRFAFLKPLAMIGCLAIIWLAARALIAAVRGSHLEGYILLIALALILQALLTLATLPTAQDRTELKF